MKTFLKTFLMDESGASAAEYALILAVVGTAIVLGGFALAGAIGDRMQNTADCITTPGTASAPNC